jgi:general secretion pathway protein G
MNPNRRHRLLRARRNRAGMTLIEIIIVIILVTTVMTIVAAGVLGAKDDADCQQTKLVIKKVEQQLQLYAAKHKGQYPSTSEGLGAIEKYLEGASQDAWGHDLLYFSPGTQSGDQYEIMSLGKDGVEGGEGNDGDIRSWALDEACL